MKGVPGSDQKRIRILQASKFPAARDKVPATQPPLIKHWQLVHWATPAAPPVLMATVPQVCRCYDSPKGTPKYGHGLGSVLKLRGSKMWQLGYSNSRFGSNEITIWVFKNWVPQRRWFLITISVWIAVLGIPTLLEWDNPPISFCIPAA